MSWPGLLTTLGNAALDLLAPPTCPGCNAALQAAAWTSVPTSPFCNACELAIAPRDPQACASCRRPAGGGGLCRRCHRKLAPLSAVWAAFDYEGPIATSIQALKYEGRDDLAVPLIRRWQAEWPPEIAAAEVARNCLIVPVPLHPRRLARRGFDQAWLLAREVAKATGAEARPRALRRVRPTPPQVGLGRVARERNVHQAFVASLPVPGRDILLVDDVTTTGATLQACAEALVRAGARTVEGLVVARAQP